MSGGPDDAHTAGEQDALAPVDAGKLKFHKVHPVDISLLETQSKDEGVS